MIKKILAIILAAIMLLTAAGCTGNVTPSPEVVPTPDATPEPTPSEPEFEKESVDKSALSEYVIIYPENYKDWQMTEVELLKSVLETVTGKKIKTFTDKGPDNVKEIIFASSKRATKLSDYVASFESRLDYVIGVQDGDIILGGQDYYGDMRAVYTFINDYLGYDDVDDKWIDPTKEISGVEKYTYKEPVFKIAAGNFYTIPYTEAWQVRDVKDANFNAMIVQGVIWGYETMEDFRQFILWCTRFDLELVLPVSIDWEEETFSLYYLEAYEDNPIVWGHYIIDEPVTEYLNTLTKIALQYSKLYSEKGWKSFINYCGGPHNLNDVTDATDVLSFDFYYGMGSRSGYPSNLDGMGPINNGFSLFTQYEQYGESQNKDLWIFIGTYYLSNFNTSKMIRWIEYIPLCFNAKAIEYFNYQVWIVDGNYEKLEYWEDAKQANKEALFIGEKLVNEYDYVGAYLQNITPTDKERFEAFEQVTKEQFDTIEELILPEGTDSTILVGAYDKKDNSGSAFLIINVDELDFVDYEDTKAEPSRIKINGDEVHFYREGREYRLEKDSEGYYQLELGNGHCWFVMVD